MGATGYAITAILCLAFAVWMILVGADPKRWRLLWLDTLGMLDTDTTREDRRLQEFHLRLLAFALVLLLFALGGSCVYWCVEQVRENKRSKSTVERELEYLRRDAEGARGRK